MHDTTHISTHMLTLGSIHFLFFGTFFWTVTQRYFPSFLRDAPLFVRLLNWLLHVMYGLHICVGPKKVKLQIKAISLSTHIFLNWPQHWTVPKQFVFFHLHNNVCDVKPFYRTVRTNSNNLVHFSGNSMQFQLRRPSFART